jgi:hypothetical protein
MYMIPAPPSSDDKALEFRKKIENLQRAAMKVLAHARHHQECQPFSRYKGCVCGLWELRRALKESIEP